jgi:hypothetical protein
MGKFYLKKSTAKAARNKNEIVVKHGKTYCIKKRK